MPDATGLKAAVVELLWASVNSMRPEAGCMLMRVFNDVAETSIPRKSKCGTPSLGQTYLNFLAASSF